MPDHYLSEQHQNLLLKVMQQMKLSMEHTRMSSTQIHTDLPLSTTVGAINPDVELFQEFCKTLHISLDNKNLSNNDEQQSLNNALYQCQIKTPTMTLNFAQFQLSIEESSSGSDRSAANQEIIRMHPTSSNETTNNSGYVSYGGTYVWKITHFKQKMSKYNDYLL
jgi:hypothetical protein